MKQFNTLAEALLVTAAKPESDSVGSVCPCQSQPKDMLTQAAEDAMGKMGGVTQPNDDVGEFGEVEGDLGDNMEAMDGDGVDVECMGEEGMIVKFSGTAILLPKNVIEKIKAYEPEESEETEGDNSEHEESETTEEEHEENESESTEKSEEESGDEDEEDDDKKEKKSSKAFDVNESVNIKKSK
jgi:hypothetical protein